MKILGIVGSPRKNGNTSFLVQQALDAANREGIETNIVYLSDYDISDCLGCEGCRDTFACVIKDGMQHIYPLIEEADAIVLGSPTYFYDVTAITKAFLDRCYCYEVFDDEDRSVWMGVAKALGGKLAVVLSVCEQKRAEDAGYAAKTMQLTLQALGYRVTDSVEIIDLFKRQEAQSDNDAQSQAREAGQRLAKTMLLKQKIRAKCGVKA